MTVATRMGILPRARFTIPPPSCPGPVQANHAMLAGQRQWGQIPGDLLFEWTEIIAPNIEQMLAATKARAPGCQRIIHPPRTFRTLASGSTLALYQSAR